MEQFAPKGEPKKLKGEAKRFDRATTHVAPLVKKIIQRLKATPGIANPSVAITGTLKVPARPSKAGRGRPAPRGRNPQG